MATEQKDSMQVPEPGAMPYRLLLADLKPLANNDEALAAFKTQMLDPAKAAANPEDPASMYRAKVLETVYTATKIARPGKGILAADESYGTIKKRFKDIEYLVLEGVDDPEGGDDEAAKVNAPHQAYRELLFQSLTGDGPISGVITWEGTLNNGYVGQNAGNQSFANLLMEKGIEVGIKVDAGAKKDLAQLPGSPYTAGLDKLAKMAAAAYEQGARFAKWRATLKIKNGYIEQAAVQETAWTLARYASICQVNGLAPIVEPEILMDGNHSLDVNQYWTEKVLNACYKALVDQEVILEGTLLKPNMCLPGVDSAEVADDKKFCDDAQAAGDQDAVREKQSQMNKRYALATVTALRRTVPASVPGVVFLSGGQSEEEATLRLNEINVLGPHPWNLSFSYGRALQKSCLMAWQGKTENVEAAQKQFLARASANSAAQLGEYPGSGAFYDSLLGEGAGNSVGAFEGSFTANYAY